MGYYLVHITLKHSAFGKPVMCTVSSPHEYQTLISFA